MRVVLLIAVLLGALCHPAVGQTVFSRPYEPNQIVVEAVVPELPNQDSSFPSGATFLTATRSLNDNVQLAAELPLAHYAQGGTSASAVGNPYVGVGLSSTRIPLLIELGVRLPTVPSNQAPVVGRRADLGRTAAFRDEAVSLSGLLNTRLALSRATSLRLRAGLTYASVDTDRTNHAAHWEVPYSAQLWWERPRLLTGLSFVGRPSINEAPDAGRARHRAVLSVMRNGDRFQPGLMLGTGLDPLFEDGQIVFVGGLTLSFSQGR